MTHQSWDNILLPPAYSYGFAGGPAWNTQAYAVDGGGQQRVQFERDPTWRWSAVRRNFRDAAGNPNDVTQLIRFFNSRRGSFYGFLFADPLHYSTAPDGRGAWDATDQVIGIGDGSNARFKTRVQTLATGDFSSRAHVRDVVALHGRTEPAFARMAGLTPETQTIVAEVAVDGLVDGSAVWSPMTREVILSSAPAIGAQVTWGGYFAVPARFADSTDQGLEATVSGFLNDEAPFEIDSLPSDEEVPFIPGGTPFGAESHVNLSTGIARWPGDGFLQLVDPNGTQSFHLWNPSSTPTGGPFFRIENTSVTGTLQIRDHAGLLVGTLTNGTGAFLFLAVDGSGDPIWMLIP